MTYGHDLRLLEKDADVFISALKLVVAHCEKREKDDISYSFGKESAEAVLGGGRWKVEAPLQFVWEAYLGWFTAYSLDIENALKLVVKDCKAKVNNGEIYPYQFQYNLALRGLEMLEKGVWGFQSSFALECFINEMEQMDGLEINVAH